METNKIKVITLKSCGTPQVTMIENDLKTYQSLVGGHIDVVSIGDNIEVILNDEGKLIGLEPNLIYYSDIIVGDVVFIAVDDFNEDEDFTSLSDIQIKKVHEYIHENKVFKIGNILLANKGRR